MKTIFFTGFGDKGSSEVGGKKFSKDEQVFELLGSLDELNSFIGFARANAKKIKDSGEKNSIQDSLKRLQELLFIAQAEVAALAFHHRSAELKKIKKEHVEYLEETITGIDAILPPLNAFIISGEDELSACVDIARTAARRTERIAVKTSDELSLSPEFLQFFNRLSSVLFALARYASHEQKIKEDHPKYK